ncbi:papilin-like protein [Dinothrombium tinctorium]|uniref:Papilin-like protein n=1 Tax=Dinothrombium tinctorium TaxID=1965070 RepID=A0A3S3PCV7_9ACAR|nr:papilin-like protein [Dinothrombium tinctorium]RWS06174.1 papilin-like protein [Dinothrombium tinctorium]
MNASMLSIHSEEELDYVETLLDSSQTYWLGAIQLANSLPSFIWLDGSAFDFAKWKLGFPKTEKGRRCVAIAMDINGWWEENCESNFRQICQKTNDSLDLFFDKKFSNHFISALAKNQLLLRDKMTAIENEHENMRENIIEDLKSLEEMRSDETIKTLAVEEEESDEIERKRKEKKVNCTEPVNSGQCDKDIIRVYYDHKTTTCKAFSYSGCGGNSNRFISVKNCYRLCHPYYQQQMLKRQQKITKASATETFPDILTLITESTKTVSATKSSNGCLITHRSSN